MSARNTKGTCLAGLHVTPEALLAQRVPLDGHVAGLRQRQLQHQRARVVRDAAHHVQPPGRARHNHVVLPEQEQQILEPCALKLLCQHLAAAGRHAPSLGD